MSDTANTTPEWQEIGRQLRQQADHARSEVVAQLQNAAETIRKEASAATLQEDERRAVEGIATGLERAASYLSSRNIDQMGEDATAVLRKRPVRAMLIALIVGVILGWLFSRGRD
jgi:ElaB/YqjD/DUF883 family membrane-anchored ribosome-binding protein